MNRARARIFTIDFRFAVAAIVAALGIGGLIIALTGRSPVTALTAMLTGPVATLSRAGQWLDLASTLTLAGLGAAVLGQTRQISLGAPAQAIVGGTGAALAASIVRWPPGLGILAPLAAAAGAGALAAWLPGVLKARLRVNELVTSLMLNFILMGVLGLFFQYGGGRFFVDPIPPASQLPKFSEITDGAWGRLHVGVILAPLAAVAIWAALYRTAAGYEIRMTGANAAFARYAGIDAPRAIIRAFLWSGAVTGLTGALSVMGVFRDAGFASFPALALDALIVAALARNQPLAVPFAALAYAYLSVGADRMEQRASVGAEVVLIVQAVILLCVAARRRR